MNLMSIIKTLILIFLITGCASTQRLPDATPDINKIASASISSSWSEKTDPEFPINLSWQQLDDAVLTDLIAQGLNNNLNLKNAYLSMQQALINFDNVKLSQKINYNSNVGGNYSVAANGTTSQSYSLSGSATYEIDLWGRIAASVKGQELSIENIEANLKTTRISLAANIAIQYLRLRVEDEVLLLRQQQLNILNKSREITAVRLEEGTITRLGLDQLDVTIQQNKNSIESLLAQRRQTKQSLAIVLGLTPGSFKLEKTPLNQFAIPRFKPDVPTSILLNRPDIQQAERAIKQAHLSLHQARTAFLPTMSLSASASTGSNNLADFFSIGKIARTAAAMFSQTILDNGRRKRNVAVSKINIEQNLNNYQNAILSALRDVEVALINQNTNIRQIEILKLQIEAQKRATNITNVQYQEGSISAFDFLREQNSILSSRESEIRAWQTGINVYISLLRELAIDPLL